MICRPLQLCVRPRIEFVHSSNNTVIRQNQKEKYHRFTYILGVFFLEDGHVPIDDVKPSLDFPKIKKAITRWEKKRRK